MDVKTDFREVKGRSGKLAEAAPETMKAFGALRDSVLKEGKLPLKTKELIALMLGLAARCMPCIMTHAQKAIEAGVTREEVAEAIEVAILMGGGPASAYGGIVLEVYDQLKSK